MAADLSIVDLTSSDDDAQGENGELLCVFSSASNSSVTEVDNQQEVMFSVGVDDDDDDDVVILDNQPCPKRARKTLAGGSDCCNRTNTSEDAADLDCCIVELDTDCNLWQRQCSGDDAEDVIITGEIGQVACRDFPHSRHLCAQFPFKITSHKSHCVQCHCYVCDLQAPCLLWGIGINANDHCHATDVEDKWRQLRESTRKNKLMPLVFPAKNLKRPSLRPLVINLAQGLPSSIPLMPNSLTQPAVTTSNYMAHTSVPLLNATCDSPSLLGTPQKRPIVIPPVRFRTIQKTLKNPVPTHVVTRPKMPFPRPHQAVPTWNYLAHKSSRRIDQADHCQSWQRAQSCQRQSNTLSAVSFPDSSALPCILPSQNFPTFVAKEKISSPFSSQEPELRCPDVIDSSFLETNVPGLGQTKPTVKDLSFITGATLTGLCSQASSEIPDAVYEHNILGSKCPTVTTPCLPDIPNANSTALSVSGNTQSALPQEKSPKISQPQSHGSWTVSSAVVNSPDDLRWVDDLLESSQPLPSGQDEQQTILADFLAQLHADDDFWDFNFSAGVLGQI